ncbi:MAG: FAD-dependent oxidoreductase [Candidatus Entotheonella factor]|uniref:FAD-dependent oxidoreductase n=1 Tax=Entotheonella factor TaxID=1429438 RepID=W4LGE0_ENTF1|nr:MAG: FAD-dependent oxidoreductase [Candidatus Entotheonella factor]
MKVRQRHIQALNEVTYDALIIGGGINGAVSAAALSGNGLKTALIDQRDFAGFTSQQSSNLAWGGIKYLETFEFGLVRQLCKSRNELMQHYPSSVREIRFLTTIQKGFRHHPVILWCGAWLYWLMGNGFTRVPRLLSARRIKRDEPVIQTGGSLGGMEYSDAYLYDNDARFVFNFVRSALDDGCIAANYVASLGSHRSDDLWHTRVQDVTTGRELTIRSRVLINATGPFVDAMNGLSGESTPHRHVFSKGIHLIVDRVTPNPRVLAFFADDGRLFFVIPMGAKTCIGTTDTRVNSPLAEVTEADRDFVLAQVNQRLALERPLGADDVIAERCGVRPLAVEGQTDSQQDFLNLSRKHAIDVNMERAHISIFGGKLTDCLNVGEEICTMVEALGLPLPGPRQKWYGEPDRAVRADFMQRARAIQLDELTPADSEEALSIRLWRRYGSQAFELLKAIEKDPVQAEPILAGTAFIRCEIELMAQREMIVTLEDFLRRRSDLALVTRHQELRRAAGLMDVCTILFGPDQAVQQFNDYFDTEPAAGAAAPRRVSRELASSLPESQRHEPQT